MMLRRGGAGTCRRRRRGCGRNRKRHAAAEGTFTYWGGLIFPRAANQMLVDRIEQWGAEQGIDVEVVAINQNETVQRVSPPLKQAPCRARWTWAHLHGLARHPGATGTAG
ncbi:MAG: hypothetical protein R2838_21315 [Caldilineaceae bacterium]